VHKTAQRVLLLEYLNAAKRAQAAAAVKAEWPAIKDLLLADDVRDQQLGNQVPAAPAE
jgi:hypothetical protein